MSVDDVFRKRLHEYNEQEVAEHALLQEAEAFAQELVKQIPDELWGRIERVSFIEGDRILCNIGQTRGHLPCSVTNKGEPTFGSPGYTRCAISVRMAGEWLEVAHRFADRLKQQSS